jgi:hypothetical protein
MRTTIMTWVTSSVILIGGAVLVALAQGANERLEAQSTPALSIDTRELTEKATGPLPLQFYDVI